MNTTAEIAEPIQGDKLYQKRARLALPILVRQAEAGNSILYSELAAELDMPNPRNLNYVLGSIGQALVRLGNEWGESIPVLQCIVLNKQQGLPGDGIGWFVKDSAEFAELPVREKRRLVDGILAQVFAYPRWDHVLVAFGLEHATSDYRGLLAQAAQFRGRGGESDEHRRLKEYVARTPNLVGLPKSAGIGGMEVSLPSGDVVDVVFQTTGLRHAVEVKSHISSDVDIARGLFQCVKYTAVLRAYLTASGSRDDAISTLVLGRRFPETLRELRHSLGVRVIDNVDSQ